MRAFSIQRCNGALARARAHRDSLLSFKTIKRPATEQSISCSSLGGRSNCDGTVTGLLPAECRLQARYQSVIAFTAPPSRVYVCNAMCLLAPTRDCLDLPWCSVALLPDSLSGRSPNFQRARLGLRTCLTPFSLLLSEFLGGLCTNIAILLDFSRILWKLFRAIF